VTADTLNDLTYENFHGRLIRVDGAPYMVVAFDRDGTQGIVLRADKKPILGWSTKDNSVRVLGKQELEWQGTDLLDTIRVALVMLTANEVPS
jgi:hypothetical protein